MQGLGYRPDTPDSRDHKFQSLGIKATLPIQFDLSNLVEEVLNQSSLGSCVINAIAQGRRIAILHHTGNYTQVFSRLFGYWHARNQHGEANKDNGTYIRIAIKVLNKLGHPPEKVWPYSTEKFKEKPPPVVAMTAIDNRKTRYHRIEGSDRLFDVKQAIYNHRPVVFGTDVGKSLISYQGGILDIPTDYLGGHAMLILGWDDSLKSFLVLNSWGEAWGEKGYCWLTYKYIQWTKTRDLWSISI
jgi:C1A family cysteine protease